MDPDQQQAFAEAVERKKAEAKAASEQHRPVGGPPGADPSGVQEETAAGIYENQSQDSASIRDKNTRKGQVTADKWNQ